MDAYQRLFVRERLDLCDLLGGLDEEEWSAATLDEGWTVADLAAHIVVREQHVLEMTRALLFKGRAGPDVEALMACEKARGHDALLAALRTMPPLVFRFPGAIARGNLGEAYIHHEDARRGGLQRPRLVTEELQRGLWECLPIFVARPLRGVPLAGTLTLSWPEHDRRMLPLGPGRRARAGGPAATLSGEPGELLLWLTGRKAAARVELTGGDALVATLRDAPLSI
jgi:uncharacterized protein (TIGR03085 family)